MSRGFRIWLLLILAVAGGVITCHLLIDWWTREPSNYSRIEDGLYVGGFVSAPPKNTRAVLNLCEAADGFRGEVHEWHPIADAAPAPSLDWLRDRVRFVEEQVAAKRVVYIHCRNGVSRSGMVAAAYLMKRDHLTRDQALARLRESRPIIRPNPVFLELLAEYERDRD